MNHQTAAIIEDAHSAEVIGLTAAPALTEAARLAQRAREGLRKVALGEDLTVTGWLEYGAALNGGRRLFPSDDRGFGHWLTCHNLQQVDRNDQAAAMWAAANLDTFTATRRLHPNVRTVRGLHAKWKEAQRPQPKPKLEEPTDDELRVVQKLQAIVDHPTTDPQVRDAAQRKLDKYTERFGQIEPETPKQRLTKKELAANITGLALKKAARNKKAFEIIEYAIRNTYGTSEEYLERVLRAIEDC